MNKSLWQKAKEFGIKMLGGNIGTVSMSSGTGGTNLAVNDGVDVGNAYTEYDSRLGVALMSNSFAFACVNTIVETAAIPELKLKDSNGNEIQFEQVGKNKLLDLLYHPNPLMTFTSFHKKIIGHLQTYGGVYIYGDAVGLDKMPSKLIIFNPCTIKVKFNIYGYPEKFTFDDGQNRQELDSNYLIYISMWNPNSSFIGLPPMKIALGDVRTLNKARQFNHNFFDNSTILGGILETEQQMESKLRNEILELFNDKFQGVRKSHRTGILTHGLKFNSLSANYRDMEYINGIRVLKQDIYSAFRVPPALVGLFEHAPQFNTKEQQKIFYYTNIIPLNKLVVEMLNEKLVPMFYKNNDAYLDFDYSNVEALKEDNVAKASAANIYHTIMGYPLNVVKDGLNLPFPDMDWGDERPVTSQGFDNLFGLSLTPDMIAAKPANYKTFEVRGNKTYMRPKYAQLRQKQAAKKHICESFFPSLSAVMSKHWKEQLAQLNEFIKNNPDSLPYYDSVFKSKDEQARVLFVEKSSTIGEIFTTGMQFEQAFLRKAFPKKSFDFMRKDYVADRVGFWIKNNVFNWALGIEETTANEIYTLIESGISEGSSNAQIQKSLREYFAGQGVDTTGTTRSIYSRIENIVHTESAAVMNESALETYKAESLIALKGWLSAMTETTREGHAALNFVEIPKDKLFRNPITGNEAEAPGRFGKAAEDCFCLCDIYPILQA